MSLAFFRSAVLAGLLLFPALGCRESSSETQVARDLPQQELETLLPILSAEWAGTERIAADTNAESVRAIAALPESVKLLEQTLERLSRAPWVLQDRRVDTNAAALLRHLLNDIVRNEAWLELTQTSSDSPGMVLAIRLEPDQSSIWETNIGLLAESLLGAHPIRENGPQRGWVSKMWETSNSSNSTSLQRVAFGRLEHWTIVALGRSEAFDAILKRIPTEIEAKEKSTHWLRIQAHLASFPAFSVLTNVFSPLPSLDVCFGGKDLQVWTEMTINFPSALDLDLQPWSVPTNLIEHPTAAFSAVRGLDRLLANSRVWRNLGVSQSPGQMFAWATDEQPRMTFFAAEVPQASNFVAQLTELVVPTGEGWTTANGMGGFKKSAAYDGIEWQGLPYLWPFLRSAGQRFVLGGAFLHFPPVRPETMDWFANRLNDDDLIYYGWEKSGPRSEHWLFMGQFFRFTSGRAQLPFESPGVLWLKALTQQLGETVTRVDRASNSEFRFARVSSLGFTGIELQLLVDWLESPRFPRSLHTLLAEPEAEGP